LIAAGLGTCIGLVTVDGQGCSVGQADTLLTILSVSTAYATGLADKGTAFITRKVGVESSGLGLNRHLRRVQVV
jgi:glutaminase